MTEPAAKEPFAVLAPDLTEILVMLANGLALGVFAELASSLDRAKFSAATRFGRAVVGSRS